MSENPVLIFISYKHSKRGRQGDKKYVDEFIDYARRTIENAGGKFLRDTDLKIGDKWDDKLRDWLKVTDIFMAFVNQAYLDSPYISQVEVKDTLERGRADIFAIIVGTAILEQAEWLTRRQVYPPPPNPPLNLVHLESNRDVHYKEILLQLEQKVREKLADPLRSSKATLPLTSVDLTVPENDVNALKLPKVPSLVEQRFSEVDAHLNEGLTTFREHKTERYHAALSHYDTALDLVSRLPNEPEQVLREMQALVGSGLLLQILSGYTSVDAERRISRAEQLYRELPNKLRNSPDQFPIVYGLWVFHFVAAHLDIASMLVSILEALARRSRDPATKIEAKVARGATELRLGNIKRALERYLNPAFSAYKKHMANLQPFIQDVGVTAQIESAFALWLLGYTDEAVSAIYIANAIASWLKHDYTIGFAVSHSAMIFLHCGNIDETERYLTLARKFDDLPTPQAIGTTFQGWVQAEKGDIKGGLREFSRAFDDWSERMGARIGRTEILSILVELCIKAGQLDDAEFRLRQAFTEMRTTGGEHWFEPELERLQGELILAHNRSDAKAAMTQFDKAIELSSSEKVSSRSLELRAVISKSMLLQRLGEVNQAKHLLEDILNKFRSVRSETSDLKRARALLQKLS